MDAKQEEREREETEQARHGVGTRSLAALQEMAAEQLNLVIPTDARVVDAIACLNTYATGSPAAALWHKALQMQWEQYVVQMGRNMPVEVLRDEELLHGPRPLLRLLRPVTFAEAFHIGYEGAPLAVQAAAMALPYELRMRLPLLGLPFAESAPAETDATAAKRRRTERGRLWDEGVLRRAVLTYWAQGTDDAASHWYTERVRPAVMALRTDMLALGEQLAAMRVQGDNYAFEPFATEGSRRDRLRAAVRAFHARMHEQLPRSKDWRALDAQLQRSLADVAAARAEAKRKWDELEAGAAAVRSWADAVETRAITTQCVRGFNDFLARLDAEPLNLQPAPHTHTDLTKLIETSLDIYRRSEAPIELPPLPTAADGAEWVRTVQDLSGPGSLDPLYRVRSWRAQIYMAAMQCDQLRAREARLLQFTRAASGTAPAQWAAAWDALCEVNDATETEMLERAAGLDASTRVCEAFSDLARACKWALESVVEKLDAEFPMVLPAHVSQQAPVLPEAFAGALLGEHANDFISDCLAVVELGRPHADRSPALLALLHKLNAAPDVDNVQGCLALVHPVAAVTFLLQHLAACAQNTN